MADFHTAGTFVIRFPEFDEVDAPSIEEALDEAELEIDVSVWGKFSKSGHGFLTAHKLANSPFGNAAKLVAKNNGDKTVYEGEYKKLLRIATAGIRST